MVVPQTEIIISKDGAELLRRVVAPGEYVIGRGEDCAFRVEGEKVSRHHARLFVSFQDWSVADLGSANGTQLGEQHVGAEAVKVWPSQIIRVGDATIELRALVQTEPDATLMPTQEAVRRHLPPELQGTRRYQIGKQVAQGGMGAILDALDVSTRRNVAMKVMLNVTDPGDVLRFIEEAQVTAQLEHPNIVPVHELSVNEQGEVFYTMKMVRGITLKKVIELLANESGTGVPPANAKNSGGTPVPPSKKYPLAALLTIFQKVCDAIAFAHSKGVIHRDLKPENIMLGDYGEVLVMDWGLARLVGSTERVSVVRSAKADEGDAMRTQTGTVMGTPTYMSPEQARGEIEKLDARSDIYALGTILFELLHLRPAVTGAEVMQVVSKVQRGEVEWDAPKSAISNRQSPIPASLLAVCRKSLALSITARYPHVEDLQADLLAFQNGFATSAENAGLARQLLLALKRHKIAAIGAAAVLLVGTTLGTKAIIEGNRAEREGVRATKALADLKKQAPALRQLAESEAGFQRFDSALASLDAALALEPEHLPGYWRRAWLFIGMNRLTDAAAAIRIAQEKDPANAKLAAILPAIEKLAALPPTEQWPAESARQVYEHLVRVRASGETVAIAPKTQLSLKENEGIVRKRVREWLGSEPGERVKEQFGTLRVNVGTLGIDTLEPLRGLHFDVLNLDNTNVRNLEPLRGMQLVELTMTFGKVSDISPLRGMPLRSLILYYTWVSDLSALQGAPLETLDCTNLQKLGDFSPVQSAPLKSVAITHTAVKDLRFLTNCPVESLKAGATAISDLSPLRGKPLKLLSIPDTKASDLTPLRGAPIIELHIHLNHRFKDLTPLMELPKLEKLRVSKLGKLLEPLRHHPTLKLIAYDDDPYRPVAEFWAEYDAKAK